MKNNFIKNRKQQIIAVYDEWGNEIDIPVIFNKKNIFNQGIIIYTLFYFLMLFHILAN